ncbi:hypothetical protein PMG71_09290 [Roseofilum sp. BLCC_M154]|uniref:Uncharacterized protein n=1 Tax=Roseofilum acuticapitatum BLCC-M154 TaxID=3022444 RepID=A0ABT7ARU2_9CYAN|nr:hypothetical protein [Roseofilum acuticapitatum]MDJ1169618.1 hypothetical protein [Roseofilum acuticapitatum BLCC-M154]
MTSTLSSRFQGALWGAAIADFSSPLSDSVWSKLVVCGCQQLIQQGTLRPQNLPVAQPWEVTGLILPISLYFHEDLDSLVDGWRAIANHYQLSSEWHTPGLLLAISLSALVEGYVSPRDLIAYGRSHLAHFSHYALDDFPLDSPLIEGLQTFVKSSYSFPGAIALAQKTCSHPSLSSRIAATLCGTHQTRLGIPLPWQVFLDHKIKDPHTPWPHGIGQLNTLSAHLLASWSGADWVIRNPE